MSEPTEIPLEEKVSYLEDELKSTQKQIMNITQELMGTVILLCLPLSKGRRLELGFKQIRKIPDAILKTIIETYVGESKHSDLNFDEMISPVVTMLGFERSWKILPTEIIRKYYGDYSAAKWMEMAKDHNCEEEN